MLGKNSEIFAKHCNTTEKDPDEYVAATFNKVVSDSPLSLVIIKTY